MITYGKLQTIVISSDLKQKMQDISEQYYDELSWDMEKEKHNRISLASSFSRLNGEFRIT